MFVFGPGYHTNTTALSYTTVPPDDDYRLTLDVSRLEIKYLSLVAIQLGVDINGTDDVELNLITVGTRVEGKEAGSYLRPVRKFSKRYAAFQYALTNPVNPEAVYIELEGLYNREVNILTLMLVTSLR